MLESIPVQIQGAVEGPLDEVILRRLIFHVESEPGTIYGNQGKQNLLQRLHGFNQAALFSPWAVLIDLDQDEGCAPIFLSKHLPQPMPKMCCRVVVRSIETWLIADREHLARFLNIAIAKIPQNPEPLINPKQTLVDLARHSRKRDIREDMVPRPSSGRSVGPAYVSRLIEFVETGKNKWRPEIAAQNSDSLARCIRCLHRIAER